MSARSFCRLVAPAVFCVATTSMAAPAKSPPPTESDRAAALIGQALKTYGPDVHRCFEKALADRLDVAGHIELSLDMGAGGAVSAAKLLEGQNVPEPLSTCVTTAAAKWKLAGFDPGTQVVLPFGFSGQTDQYVVKTADVPDRGPAAAAKPGTKVQAPFRVKVLVDPENVRGPNASLTLLTVGPASRVAMHRHPHSAKILYLLKGKARVLGVGGAAPIKLDEGSAVYLPVGHPHVIENMGRQADAVFLQAFSPPGPERVYRTPQDPAARAEFEVIRNPATAKATGTPVVVAATDVKPLSVHGGKVSARILFDESVTGDKAMSLQVMEFQPGSEVARHEHPGSTELLYVASGGGTLTVGSEKTPFASEETLHIPAGQPHAVAFASGAPTVAVQVYAPAGPEQRFRQPATDKPAAKK